MMNPHFHTDFSISDSLIFVRKSVLIYETIIHDKLQEKRRKIHLTPSYSNYTDPIF